MKFLSVLVCVCLLLDVYAEVAAKRRTYKGNLRSFEMGANGNRRNLGAHNSKGSKGKGGKMNKLASSKEGKGKGKATAKTQEGKGKAKEGKGKTGKTSKKSSKKERMGKGKGSKKDVSMSPSSMPSPIPTPNPSAMPSRKPIAVSLDASNDAISSIDDGPISHKTPSGPISSKAPTESVDDGPISNKTPTGSADDVGGNREDTSSPAGDFVPVLTPSPIAVETKAPVVPLTKAPTRSGTSGPSSPLIVTTGPTYTPTAKPKLTQAPVTSGPTKPPTKAPTREPTKPPTGRPTGTPTGTPTKTPSSPPPTGSPTKGPTKTPTKSPTEIPVTIIPTDAPVTTIPTDTPVTIIPTGAPVTITPTGTPSKAPTTSSPTSIPTIANRVGDDIVDMIPLISILQARLEPKSYYGGAEFEDPNSYQYKALLRVEEQKGVQMMNNRKLIQYYVLYCIYEATGGAGWVTASGWTRTDLWPCNGFFGVSCDEDNSIVGINLYDNGLTGQFPPEITLLASDGYRSTGAGHLRSLDLYLNTNLGNGNDSYWVSELGSGLRYLFLGQTAFGGTIPKLPSGLIEFDASHTNINGGLVASNFEGLNHLTWLLLDGCSFQTSIPTEFAELPKLEYFYISDAEITGDLSYLAGMPVLFEHFASNNPGLGGELFDFIGDIESLASLNLAGNGLEGTIPTTIGNLANLQQLWLNDNNLTGQIPTEMSRMISLKTLELEGNNLVGDFPQGICDLKDPAYGYLTLLGADCSVHKCECCDCCSTQLCQAL